ncbi:hypothetical protein Gohar_015134 [Gossypium harknessii]|uniref:Uncharacterized protein n=1 Tax=Gossypium harknessii TaxID=34285 RepID=A0A7J9FYT5_9ROSI|nr:hypothetical protein [Gossypium harknessii]
MLRNPRLSTLNEDKECLTKIIDKCQNNSSYYHIQVGIDLIAKAKYLLQQKDYQFRTDGRRVLAYHSYDFITEKDDEGIRLLKKIADMDIKVFHLIFWNKSEGHGKTVIKIYLPFIIMVKVKKDGDLKERKSTYQQQSLAKVEVIMMQAAVM